VKADPAKIQAVKDWPLPKNIKELQSFLGLANFLRRYIQGFSFLTAPLTSITDQQSASFPWQNWPEDKKKALEDVKHALTSSPVLTLPDFAKPFDVRTDASVLGTGGVLMQQPGHVIAYTSHKFSPAERNYHTTDQELLAIVRACKEWRCYLEGSEVNLITDHQPLTYLKTKQDLSRRQARWSEFLSRFNFKIVYSPGSGNVADPISRSPLLALVRQAVSGLLAVVTRSKRVRIDAPPSPPQPEAPALPNPTVPSLENDTRPLPPAHPTALKQQILAAYNSDPLMSDRTYTDQFDMSEDGFYITSNGTVLIPNNAGF